MELERYVWFLKLLFDLMTWYVIKKLIKWILA